MTTAGNQTENGGGMGWWFALIIGTILAAVGLGWFALGETARPAAVRAAMGEEGGDARPSGAPSDEEGLRALSRDPAWLARGKTVYAGLCWTCHGQQGEGTIQGPSLRDERWIIEPTARNILDVIRNGRPNTAMQAMRDWYSADDLAAVAAYVADLARQGGPSTADPEGLHGPLDW